MSRQLVTGQKPLSGVAYAPLSKEEEYVMRVPTGVQDTPHLTFILMRRGSQ